MLALLHDDAVFPSDWLPWWAALIAVVLALLYLLMFMLMPFSVFGLKGRLDMIEARLADIETELRAAAHHPAEPARPPPAAVAVPPPPPARPRPPSRVEPRLDWPRT